MAWTTPITAAVNSTFTAAQWNAGVRDNLLITAPAISTTSGWIVCSSGANQIAEREVKQAVNNTSGTTASTTYTATLTGGGTSPSVTVTTSNASMVFMSCNQGVSATATVITNFDLNGAVTPSDNRGILTERTASADGQRDDRVGVTNGFMTLTPGSNTFQMLYRVTAGTGQYQKRCLVVMAL